MGDGFFEWKLFELIGSKKGLRLRLIRLELLFTFLLKLINYKNYSGLSVFKTSSSLNQVALFVFIHKKNAEASPSNRLSLKFASHYHPNDNYHSYIGFAAGE